LAFRPDGRFLASTGIDRTIILWDLRNSCAVRKYIFSRGDVRSLVFNSTGTQLLVAADSETAVLFDVVSGKTIREFSGSKPGSNTVAIFSSDERRIYTGSHQAIQIWDVGTGKLISTWSGHSGSVNSLALSPDGKVLISGSDDKTVVLRSAETGRIQAVLRDHREGVKGVAFSPDGRLFASNSRDQTIVWDALSDRKVAICGDGFSSDCLVFSADGRRLFAGTNHVVIWDSHSGKQIGILSHPKQKAYFLGGEGSAPVAVSTDGKLLAGGVFEGNISIWNADSLDILQTIKGQVEDISSLAVSSNGDSIVSGSWTGTFWPIKVWNASKAPILRRIEWDHSVVRSVAWSASDATIAAGSEEGFAGIWNADDGRLIHTLQGHTNVVSCVSFSSDGRTILTAAADDVIRLWKAKGGEEVRTFEIGKEEGLAPLNSRSVESAAWSADCKTVATSITGLSLHDVKTGSRIRPYPDGDIHYSAIAYSPDGKYLAASFHDGIAIWNVATEKLARKLNTVGSADSISFSNDGSTLVSSSWAREAISWNVRTGVKLQTFRSNSSFHAVALTPNGRVLVSGHNDGSIKLWDFATGKLLLTLLNLNDGEDWLVYTPDGKFDGSERALQLVTCQVDGELRVIAANQCSQDRHRPGLFGKILPTGRKL
jgi:WD40 repeat protein